MGKQAALALLRELSALNIKISVHDDQLAVDAPKGRLTKGLVQKIKQAKPELLQLLRASVKEQALLPQVAPIEFRGLSFAQTRFWWLQKLEPSNNQYHIHLGLAITGLLDIAALQKAFAALLQRHQVLRSVYQQARGELKVCLLDEAQLQSRIHEIFQLIDLRNQATTDKLMETRLDELCQPAFDLAQELPIRGLLLRLAEQHYQLHWCVHHIAIDAWSIQRLISELSVLYAVYSQNTEHKSPLAPLALHYRDYAYWQQQADASGLWQQQWRYWQQQLQDLPAQHGLLLDHSRSGQTASAKLQQGLNPATLAGLKALSQRHEMTLFSLLQGVLALVFARFGSHHDIVLGSPVAGRQQPEFHDVVGCFVNTLVLRHKVDFSLSLAAFLSQVQNTVRGALAHQDLPFERLVELLKPPRQAHVNPLFQLCFALNTIDAHSAHLDQVQGSGDLSLGACRMQALPSQALAAKFDVDIAANESAEGLRIGWEYNASLFDASNMQLLFDHFIELLTTLANADASIDHLTIAALACTKTPDFDSYRHHAQQHQAINGKPSESAMCCLMRHAQQYPEALAVQHEYHGVSECWSYRELLNHCERLASVLVHQQGIKSGDRVALCLPRSAYQLLSLLALWRCGVSYVPLDHQQPQSRLVQIIDDLKPALFITESLDQAIDGVSCVSRQEWFDKAETLTVEAMASTQLTLADIQQCAYIIYTSGSTGMPKGVMVSHANVACFQQAFEHLMAPADCSSPRVTAWSSSYTFDASVEGIVALCSGHSLVVIPDAIKTDLPALREYIKAHQIQVMDFTPSQLEALWVQQNDDLALLPLTCLIVAGEAVSASLWQRLAEHSACHGVYVLQAYGPTETTVFATTIDVRSGQLPQLGYALPGTQLAVVDEQGRGLPTGAIGELAISGPGVSMGYWQRADLNRQRFIRSLVGEQGAGDYYLSGDLVRWRGDGSLQYLGRKDHQLKWRGYRIEAGEIETALNRLSSIQRSVLCLEGSGATALLVAYYESPVELEQQCIERHLSQYIPTYMRPSHYHWVQHWPLNRSGKTDLTALRTLFKQALEQPDESTNKHEARHESSPIVELKMLSDNEQQIAQHVCALFARFLKRHSIALKDDFFALGGHSLLVVHLLAEVHHEFQVEISLAQFFQHSTVEGLVELIQEPLHRASHVEMQPEAVNADHGVKNNLYSLSSAQRRYWLLNQNPLAIAQYHVPLRMRFNALDDVDCIDRAVDDLVQRHDILRTIYPSPENGIDTWPQARVVTEWCLPSTRFDASELSAQDQKKQCQLWYQDLLQQRFYLNEELPFRYAVIDLGQGVYECYWVFHHIALDDWTLDLWIKQWSESFEQHRQNEMPDKTSSGQSTQSVNTYAEYAEWERKHCATTAWQQQREYWLQQLQEAPLSHHLALDYSRHLVGSSEAWQGLKSQSWYLDQLTLLQQCAQQHGVSLFVLLQTLVVATLKVFADPSAEAGDDLLLGVVVSRRETRRWRDTAGCLSNTLVMRHRWPLTADLASAIQQVQALHQAGLAHQDYPVESLIEDLQIPRDRHTSPLFQILLDYQHKELEPSHSTVDALTVTGVAKPNLHSSKFDLQISIRSGADGLQLNWWYNQALFQPQSIEHIAQCFAALLKMVIEENMGATITVADDSTPSFHQYFDQIARQQFSLPHTHTTDAEQQLINQSPVWHGLQQRAREQESAGFNHTNTLAALSDGVGQAALSWQTLDQQSTTWAAYLHERYGVGIGDGVALQLPRSIDQILLILALWKCGAHYIPLAIDYPESRRQHILEESEACLWIHDLADDDVITQQAATLQVCGIDAFNSAVGAWQAQRSVITQAPLPDTELHRETTAYIIYTSGSTGRPKGVVVQHGALQHFQRAWLQRLETCAMSAQCFAWNASYTFDVSLEGILWLCAGRALVVTPAPVRRDPDALRRWIQQQHVDIMDFTPSHLAAVMGDDERLPVANIVLAGEAVPLALWQRLHRLCQSSTEVQAVLAAYGPTETTILATAGHLLGTTQSGQTLDVDRHSMAPHMGTPLAGVDCYVAHPMGYLQPRGALGELWLGGRQLSAYYLKQAQATACAFVPHPCSQESGARCYRTGDIARWTEGDYLRFERRLDDQIKRHGYRIELNEISAVLAQHEDVSDAAVICVDDDLVAYVVPTAINETQTLMNQGQTLENAGLVKQLQRSLSNQLPHYMLPQAFVLLKELPLNHSGKLDQKALPKPSRYQGRNHRALSPLEQQLSQLWCEVLHRNDVDIDADFYAMGGDSLRSIALLQKAQRAGIPLDLKMLLNQRNIAAIAEVLNQRNIQQSDTAALISADKESTALVVPLNQMQQWMMERYACDRQREGVFHVQHVYQLQLSTLQADRFLKQLSDTLKSCVAVFDGNALDYRHPPLIDVQRLELGSMSIESVMSEWLSQDRTKPFTNGDALCRLALWNDADGQHLLLMSHHHVLWDGWSLALLIQQLKHQVLAGDTSGPMVNHLHQAEAFCDYEQQLLANQEQSAFWQRQLNHQQVCRDSVKRVQSKNSLVNKQQIRVQSATVPQELAVWIQAYCQTHGLSPKTLFLYVWQQVLLQLDTHHERYRFVGTVSHRRHADMDTPLFAQGMYWNLVPVLMPSVEYDSNSVGEHEPLISRLQNTLDVLVEYNHYPYPQLLAMNDDHDWFAATFNYVQFDPQADHPLRPGNGESQSIAAEFFASEGLGLNTLVAHDDFGYVRQCTVQTTTEMASYRLTCLIREAIEDEPVAHSYTEAMVEWLWRWSAETLRKGQ